MTLDTRFYVYILLCSDDTFYTGHTDNLEQRVNEHHFGGKCKYTSERRPLELVWRIAFPTREQAKEIERQIKKWSQAKKRALIRGDFDLISLLAKKRDREGPASNTVSSSSGPEGR